jgi:hypothetical protein
MNLLFYTERKFRVVSNAKFGFVPDPDRSGIA